MPAQNIDKDKFNNSPRSDYSEAEKEVPSILDEGNIETFLSPKQLARKLNVSPTTIRRWEDDGVLESTRTKGGHRRYHPSNIQNAKEYQKKLEKKKAQKAYQNIHKPTQSSNTPPASPHSPLGETLENPPYEGEGTFDGVGDELSSSGDVTSTQDEVSFQGKLPVVDLFSEALTSFRKDSEGKETKETGNQKSFAGILSSPKKAILATVLLLSLFGAGQVLGHFISPPSNGGTKGGVDQSAGNVQGSQASYDSQESSFSTKSEGILYALIDKVTFQSPAGSRHSEEGGTTTEESHSTKGDQSAGISYDQRESDSPNVLSSHTSNLTNHRIISTLPWVFRNGIQIGGDVLVEGEGEISAEGRNINLGEGEITAGNVVYSLQSGDGIALTGTQFVTLENTGVLSVNNTVGSIEFTGGDGIEISDNLELSNTGVLSLEGTSNQVSVSGDTGEVTLSLPQDIGTSSVPGFGGLSISGTRLNANSSTSSGASLIGLFDNSFGNISSNTNVQTAIGDLDTAVTDLKTGEVGLWHDQTTYIEPSNLDTGKSFAILDNGRVGVGTTSPARSLDVTGGIVLGSDTSDRLTVNAYLDQSLIPTPDLAVDLGSASNRYNTVYAASINSQGLSNSGQAVFTYIPQDTTFGEATVLINPTTANTNVNLLGLGVGGFARSIIDAEGDLTLAYNGNQSAPTNSNPLSIYDHGTTEVSHITPTGGAYFGGNVGIGTSSPNKLLDVRGDIAIGSDKFIGSGQGWDCIGSCGSNSTFRLYNGANGNMEFNANFPSANMVFSVGGSEVVRFLETGNVGIGTSSPSGRLHSQIDGSAVTSTQYSGYFENLATNTTTDDIDKYGAYITSTGDFTGSTGTVTNNWGLYVDTVSGADNNYGAYFAQNVGIGTTDPGSTLQIGSAGSGTISVPGSGTNSEQFGFGADASADKSVVIGYNASASSNEDSVVIGHSAQTSHRDTVAIGQSASAGFTGGGSTAVGTNSTASNWETVALGYKSSASAQSSIAIGVLASAGNPDSIALGRSASTTASNQLVIGSDVKSITDVYIGDGVRDSTPLGFALNATGGSGTDVAGANLSLAGGKGTGAGAGGDILFKTAAAGSSGSSLNSLEDRMIITDDGKVGIGTTGPYSKFHIRNTSSAATTTGLTLDNASGNNNTGIGIDFNMGAGNSRSSYIESVRTNSGGNGATYIRFGTYDYVNNQAPLERVRIDESGNVGIGTTGPASQLDVFGTSAELRISYDASNYSTLSIGSDGKLTLADSGTATATFSEAGNTMDVPTSFTSSGDVSIANDLQFTNQTASYIKTDAPLAIETGETHESNNLTLRTYNSGRVLFDLEGTGYQQILGTDPSIVLDTATSGDTDFWLGVVEDAAGDDNDTFSIGDGSTPGSNRFLTINTGGNVGIGTTAPSASLQIASGQILMPDGSAGAPSLSFTNETNTGMYRSSGTLYFARNGGNVFWLGSNNHNVITGQFQVSTGGSTSFPAYAINTGYGNRDTGLYAPVADEIGIVNSGSETVRITSSGNVGIGTTSPLGRLHSQIDGSAVTSTQYSGYFENLATNTTTDGVDKYGAYITSTGDFTGSTGTVTNNWGLYVDTVSGADNNYGAYFAQNVGIGTTNPTANLHLSSSAQSTYLTLENTNSFGAKLEYISSTTNNAGDTGELKISAGTNGQSNLTLAGNGDAEESLITFTSANWQLGSIINNSATSKWGLKRGSSDLLIVDSSGNVGIGTTSPTSLLDVNGAITLRDGGNFLASAGNLVTPFGGFGRYENLLTYSEQLDHANWTKSGGVTVSADGTASPNGASTADSIVDDGTGGGYIQQNITSSSSTAYTFSIWLKGTGSQSISIELEDANGTSPTTTTESITLDTNWQRYNVTHTTSSDTTSLNAKVNHTSTASDTFYGWGAQLEAQTNTGLYALTTGTTISTTGRGLVANSPGPHLFTDGNVGIGTTNPNAMVDIRGSGSENTLLIQQPATWSAHPSIKIVDPDSTQEFTISGPTGNIVDFNTEATAGQAYYRFRRDSQTVAQLGSGTTFFAEGTASVPLILKGASGQTADLFQIQDSSSNTLFMVDKDGNASIGTTSPTTKLEVHDGALCVDDATASCPAGGTAGTIYAESTTITEIDLAENYPSKTELKAGEIVMVDTENKEHVERADRGQRENLIGVISTKPGITLGGHSKDDEYPVALAGRVPVKISKLSKDIKIGDNITISPEQGKGQKADSEGMVIGTALEGWSCARKDTDGTDEDESNGCKDSIMVFVNTTYYHPSALSSENTLLNPHTSDVPSAVEGGLSQSPPSNGGTKGGVSLEVEREAIFYNNVNMLGDTTVKNLAVNSYLNIGLLSIDSEDNSINVLAGDLNLQSKDGTGNVNIFKDKFVFNKKGLLEVKGKIAADEVETDVLSISSEQKIGTVIIPADKTEFLVENIDLTEQSKVFITPEQPADIGITNKVPTSIEICEPEATEVQNSNDNTEVENDKCAEGVDEYVKPGSFTLTLQNPLSEDLVVDWFVVESKKPVTNNE